MCRRCQAVAPSLRLVAAVRSGALTIPGFDLGAQTINDVASTDLIWAARLVLPASITPDGYEHHDVYTRSQSVAAYHHLTLDDLVTASRWCRTTAEHHQVDRVLLQQFGPRPMGARYEKRAPARQVLWDAHESVDRDRRRLVAEERTEDERAANHEAAAVEASDRRRTRKSRNHLAEAERARRRADRGDYLTPHERDLLGITR